MSIKYLNIAKLATFLLLLFPLIAYSNITLKHVITGIENTPLNNAKERLAIKQKGLEDSLTPDEVQHLFEQAPHEIRKALQPYGFFNANIKSRLTHPSANRWVAYYHVTPGKPLIITHIDLKIEGEGAKEKTWESVLAHFPIKTGKQFSSSNYDKAKHLLVGTASQQGYIAAKLQRHEVHINTQKKTINIVLHLNTGPRFRFGDINFSKTPLFKEAFLRRFLLFKKGDFYDQAALQTLQQNLTDSHFFNRVEVTPHLDYEKTLKKPSSSQQAQNAAFHYVPVSIKLEPNKTKQYTFGLGYGTDTGVRGLGGLKLSHMGASGQHLQALIRASELETKLTGDYIIPGSNPVTDQYSIGFAFENQHHRPGRSRSLKIIESYTTAFKNWRQTLSLNALYDASSPKGEPKRTNFILYPKMDWLHVKSDNPVKPTRGDRLQFTLLGASRSAYSSINFLQARAQAKWINTFAHRNRFVLRGTIGYTEIRSLRKLPLDLSFYAGGAQSVRGYSYKSIGPGKQLLIASAEYQYRLWGNWYITLFYDVGDANNNFIRGHDQEAAVKLKQGTGVGLLWLSKLGAIHLTLAKALNRLNQPLLVQFSMGPEL